MSDRLERERRRIIESGSPMGGHSLNQFVLKKGIEGERRINPISKKVARSEERRMGHLRGADEYEEAKMARILSRVQILQGGYDDITDAFPREVNFLREKGVLV